MQRIVWLSCVIYGWGLAALPIVAADRPNVVIILADDLGFSDLGCYGGEIQTPNLDRLAENGLRFTQFYNTARCWPSRGAIMTGYYAQQIGRDELPGLGGGARGKRPDWAPLLPEFLRPAGYHAYHSGKWHIDGPVLKGGYKRSYVLNDHNRFFHPQNHALDDKPLPPIPRGTDHYVTTGITDHAIDFLQQHQTEDAGEPFLLYLCYTSPHFPIQARPEDIAKYDGVYDVGWEVIRERRWKRLQEIGLLHSSLAPLGPERVPPWNLPEEELRQQVGPGEVGQAVPWDSLTPEQKRFQSQKMAVHAAMVDRMDQEIGRVLEQLRAMQQFDNTIVMFLSDNGASAEQIIRGDGHDPAAPVGSAATFLGIGPGWSTAANTPFRLHKSWVHEGGISTPFIIHWPQGITGKGELRHNPAHIVDVVPTVLEAAGVEKPATWNGRPIPPAPGRSLVPVLAKDGTVTREDFWWSHIGNRAIRQGDWKLVASGADGPWELYDLSQDRCERNDLAASQPEKVKELADTWTRRVEEFQRLVRAEK